jgi:hypothetical protein
VNGASRLFIAVLARACVVLHSTFVLTATREIRISVSTMHLNTITCVSFRTVRQSDLQIPRTQGSDL